MSLCLSKGLGAPAGTVLAGDRATIDRAFRARKMLGGGMRQVGHLAAAVLDVFHTEPLPDDHPFWDHPKVTVTPHVASLTVPATAAEAVAENIRRIRAGQPPEPIVDPKAGY